MNVAQLTRDNIEQYGEYDALYFQGRVLTNVQLDEKSRKLAQALTKLGVKCGDRVAIMLTNCPEVLISLNACFYLGAWATPIIFALMPEAIGYILEDSEAEVIITQRLWLHKVLFARQRAPKLKHIILVDRDESTQEYLDFNELLEQSDPIQKMAETEANDVAVLLYTSGITGRPKGVMLTHKNLYTNAIAGAESLHIQKGEVNLIALPLNHAYGIATGLTGTIFGAKSVLMSWFQPEETLKLIELHKVNTCSVVPTMLIQLLKCPNKDKYDLKSMKRWICAAAPLKVEVWENFSKTFPGKVLEAYGLTEAGPGVTINRLNMPYKPGSVGLPYPGVQVSIQDENGNILQPNERGEICVRGPNVMKGYYKHPEETAQVIRDGWLHTGDAGYIDEDGYLFLTARIKDIIIRGGENIYPPDIERVLLQHPDITDVSVVAMHDDVYGEDVMAVVVPRQGSGLSEEAVLEFCEARLAKFQRPKKVVFVPVLPKSPVGKVLKRKLRIQYGGFTEKTAKYHDGEGEE